MPVTRNKLMAVQFLRGIAASSVVLGHAITEAHQMAYGETVYSPVRWNAGVDVFFVVSGFIMIVTTYSDFGTLDASRNFMRRRLQRIVPIYWLYTTAMIVAGLLLPRQLNHPELGLWHVVSSYLFIPVARADGFIHPVLSLGWTLNYEMFFYVLFAVTLLFRRPYGLSFLAATLVGLTVLGRVFDFSSDQAVFWTDPLLLEFLMGVAIGAVYKGVGFRIGLPVFFAAICVDLLLVNILEPYPRIVSMGIPAAVLLAVFVFCDRLEEFRVIDLIGKSLGESSYSLYLSHPFTIAVVKVAWIWTVGNTLYYGFSAMGFVCALVAGWMSYWFIERRINRMFGYAFTFLKQRSLGLRVQRQSDD